MGLMKYRILWSPDAEKSYETLLANANANERTVLAAAARAINQQLVDDPFQFGESRYEDVRIGFEPPLTVQYQVMTDVRTVIVFIVSKYRRT